MRKRYVSWDRGEPDREWAGLALLAEHAPGLAPQPVRRETWEGAPAVVMTRLPGRPLGDAPLTAAQVRALADAYRRLYAVPPDAVRAAGLGERTTGPSTLRATVRLGAAEDGDLGGCRDPALVRDALLTVRTWLDEPATTPDAVVDPVLGLADGNLANVLWDGEVCPLVDFEDCGLSDPAYELADVVEHASSRLPGLLDVEALMAHVDLTGEQQERWAAYRPLFAAFWLVMLLPGNSGFRRNPVGSTEDQALQVLALLDV
ncbi:MAG: aminoglycoside phosphotransferase family protein [Nocardioides sp.]